MGLTFNDNGNVRTLTLADMATPAFQESYSDLYKGIHGIRPRGHSVEMMLHFFDTYEQEFERHQAEEDAVLAYRSEKDGIQYTSWSHYYDVKEAKDADEWEAEQAIRKAEADLKAEFARRGSPLPAIEAWEYGTL
jgi:hypothetical protein